MTAVASAAEAARTSPAPTPVLGPALVTKHPRRIGVSVMMAKWSIGVTLGRLVAPALGGWLTDQYSWRWCFFVNAPVGILAFAGLAVCPRNTASGPMRSAKASIAISTASI